MVVSNPFDRKNLTPEQQDVSRKILLDASQLLEHSKYIAPGRYRSLFITHLETAVMFANKAIAFDGCTEGQNTDSHTAADVDNNITLEEESGDGNSPDTRTYDDSPNTGT